MAAAAIGTVEIVSGVTHPEGESALRWYFLARVG
jgi:hypothetical protein